RGRRAGAGAGGLLPAYGRFYPDDKRPAGAIEVARRYARGEASLEELDAARLIAAEAEEAAEDTEGTDLTDANARQVARMVVPAARAPAGLSAARGAPLA